MTSMKKLVMVLVMALMLAGSVFAEAHKKQKLVVCMANPSEITQLSVLGSKVELKEPKMPKVVIPDGWHVVHMQIMEQSKNTTYVNIYLVLEEN